jgi:PTS system nitrogen regulatory IIA component
MDKRHRLGKDAVMSEADFDISTLAAYLHLLPQQVTRMVDRGKLPGRKVGGDWRFSRAEIHHWLEARIGAIEHDGELVEMEGVLQEGAPPEQASCTVEALMSVEHIAIPLNARTRGSVIENIVELAASTSFLWDPDKMAEAIRVREDMHSTALPGGVAMMHPRRPMPQILAQPFVVLGRTTQGIPFGGERGQLTDVFFLLCSDSDAGHLQTLARLARLINDADLLLGIRSSNSAEEAFQLLIQCESKLQS